jgi:hypothetical protein
LRRCPQINITAATIGGDLRQGDQIGRIFVHWATVYFRHFLESYRSSANFGATFSKAKYVHSFWRKNGLGYILGYFFLRQKMCIHFDEKTDWATFWATFF